MQATESAPTPGAFVTASPVWRDQRVHLRTVVPGPRSRALRAREDAFVAPGLQGYAVLSGLAIERGEGSAVTDADGNRLLDFIGGIGVGALGHSHPRIVDAIRDQVGRISVASFTSEPRVELFERPPRGSRARAGAEPRPALHERGGGRGECPAPRALAHPQARGGRLLGRLPREDGRRDVARWGRRPSRVSALRRRAPSRSRTPTAIAARSSSRIRHAASPASRSAASSSGRSRRAPSRPFSSSRCRGRRGT